MSKVLDELLALLALEKIEEACFGARARISVCGPCLADR